VTCISRFMPLMTTMPAGTASAFPQAGLVQETCISFGMSNWSSSLGAIRGALRPT